MAANGISGMPGTTAITPEAAETTPRLTGLVASWLTSALSAEPSTPAFETRKPAAMEMMSAGTWLTRPSPIVRHGVAARRRAQADMVLQDADQDAADDVDAGDDQPGHGVAAHELGRAVHGPEEGRLLLDFLAAALGRFLVDQARRQVRVDRHLLAGHGVEGEACGDLGDAG